VFSFLVMSFVIAAGAAFDASRGGDRLSAELFLMIAGPYLGMALLIVVCIFENTLR
jgi:hypothetical protein